MARDYDRWLGIDSKYGRYMFGSGNPSASTGLIDAGQTASINVRINMTFVSERFFVKRSCASNFLLRAAFMGANNEGPGIDLTHPVIAEPFATDFDLAAKIEAELFNGKVVELKINKKAADLAGQRWRMKMHVGLDLTFQVENVSDHPCRFLAAFAGLAP